MEPRISYARAGDGTLLACTAIGSGPALIVVPAAPFSFFAAEWLVPEQRQAYEALARDLRVVLFDARGNGHSSRQVADLSMESMAGDIGVVADRLGVERFGLLGTYNACLPALIYALARWTFD